MKYYQDITLLSCHEIPLSFIWGKIYMQIHLGLVSRKNAGKETSIGVSFPEYEDKAASFPLGTKLRLFAESKEELADLNVEALLFRFVNDYVDITPIEPVPSEINGYAIFERIHALKSRLPKARRYAKRHNVSLEEANAELERLAASTEKAAPVILYQSLPFIQMDSLSNGHKFRLLIHKKTVPSFSKGTFNVYGLSSSASVPIF